MKRKWCVEAIYTFGIALFFFIKILCPFPFLLHLRAAVSTHTVWCFEGIVSSYTVLRTIDFVHYAFVRSLLCSQGHCSDLFRHVGDYIVLVNNKKKSERVIKEQTIQICCMSKVPLQLYSHWHENCDGFFRLFYVALSRSISFITTKKIIHD